MKRSAGTCMCDRYGRSRTRRITTGRCRVCDRGVILLVLPIVVLVQVAPLVIALVVVPVRRTRTVTVSLVPPLRVVVVALVLAVVRPVVL